jgi:Ca2+-binding EF-hand superfamily protein
MTTSVKRGKKTKPTRTSNAFAAFEQFQIQEFKEAFCLLDQDRDGLIGLSDLEAAFSSLGKNGANTIIKEMLDESNGPLNFTMFLTLFADRMANTDNENVILNAFAVFDDDKSGKYINNI